MFLPHFDVLCDLLLNRRTATWSLFVLYIKQTNYYRESFFNFSLSTWLESQPLPTRPTLTNTKKAIWRNLLSIQIKQSRIKLRNVQMLKKMLENLETVFVIRAALWAEQLGRCLEYCRSWKNTLEKLRLRSRLGFIQFELSWMKGALATVEIIVLCGWWFSNKFDIVSETCTF